MPTDQFVHLHLHTEYSLLDGMVRIPELMQKAREFGMPAAAITDHGNLYGAIEFYQEAAKSGIKPIIGCEAYMAPGKMTDRNASSGREAAYHFTLLVKNEQGYRNLVKLVSLAHLEGQYYKPRIDKETLAKYSAGLIGLSGCLKGEINQHIQADQIAKAKTVAGEFRDIFGAENFYIEMHDHGLEAQRKCNAVLPGLAREFGLGLVAANDVHFLERAQHEAHDVMICIGTGANVADEKRMKYVPELYFKSPAEMRELFRDHPEACDNTLAIAEKCDLTLEFGKPKYPNYTPPEGIGQNEYLRKICEEGVRRRYGSGTGFQPVIGNEHRLEACATADSTTVRERLEREIAVLETQGFVNYFLITWDFIHWAKQRGIPVGPGRGSAAGSIVAYVMGITDIDPIKYKLLFERFLNPERVSPPDIDVDFCQNRRGEVIEYVRNKYGERAVAQITTFGTLGAKSVVRDVARVMGWSYGDADRVAKMIPTELNIKLTGEDKKNKDTGEKEHVPGAIDKNPELKKAVENEPATRQLWEYATTLEGLTRGVGVHAAGVVISDRDLSEYVPLARANDGSIVSQYSMQPLTDLGMLKMDFLGLKTLTVIRDAEVLIRQKTPDFDIDKIPLDDAAVYELLNRAEVIGLFQLDGGMVNWCRQFDFQSIDDIVALNALYRPGPMDLIPDYIKRKKGQTKIKYAHPLLADVCADTYGLMIYQEQVMAAARVLAGYTLGGADLLRRAMGKKDKDKMAKEREKFIAGCKKLNDIDEKKANDIFDLLEKFAGYGFNKSHSVAYGWISYQTAFMKANYPVEFMAAVLSNEYSNTEKISVFVGECQRMGMEILPPDVNRSGPKFSPEEKVDGTSKSRPGGEVAAGLDLEAQSSLSAIRYGLAGIKNVGEAAMEAAIEERGKGGPFKSLEDFCKRLDPRKINKKVLESLVKSGAFDFTGRDRAELFTTVDSALAMSAYTHRDRAQGQASMFDTLMPGAEESAPRPAKAVAVQPWPQSEKLAFEKELLGFYVTGHPLDEYRSVLESGKFAAIVSLSGLEDKSQVKIAGALVTVDKKFSKKDGKPFAIITLEDLTGQIEAPVWSEAFAKFGSLLEAGKVVSLTGKLDKREEPPRIAVNEVALLKPENVAKPIVLSFPREQTTENDLIEVRDALRQFPGTRPVTLEFVNLEGRRVRMSPGVEFRVNTTPALNEKLARWRQP